MAARDNLSRQFANTRQLTLFEPAGKLADPSETYFADLDEYMGETPEELQEYKVGESLEPGSAGSTHRPGNSGTDETLYDSIRDKGVRSPVGLLDARDRDTAQYVDRDLYYYSQVLTDGHHRVFSAAEIDPEMLVPVRWDGVDGPL